MQFSWDLWCRRARSKTRDVAHGCGTIETKSRCTSTAAPPESAWRGFVGHLAKDTVSHCKTSVTFIRYVMLDRRPSGNTPLICPTRPYTFSRISTPKRATGTSHRPHIRLAGVEHPPSAPDVGPFRQAPLSHPSQWAARITSFARCPRIASLHPSATRRANEDGASCRAGAW